MLKSLNYLRINKEAREMKKILWTLTKEIERPTCMPSFTPKQEKLLPELLELLEHKGYSLLHFIGGFGDTPVAIMSSIRFRNQEEIARGDEGAQREAEMIRKIYENALILQFGRN
jgi:hypothetical protein